MKIIISDELETAVKAAEHIASVLRKKPAAVLALAGGRSTARVFGVLCEMYGRGEIDFSAARIFAVTEFSDAEYERSCRAAMERELINKINIPAENVFFPDADNFEKYDAMIGEYGGIDLAVLGIGLNGHIGYNEPTTLFESRTHIQKLTKSTKQMLGEGMADIDRAVTMGIKTLTEASDIIMLAFGEEKADIVFKAVYGRTDSFIPAAFLQIPLQVTLYLDTCAANKL